MADTRKELVTEPNVVTSTCYKDSRMVRQNPVMGNSWGCLGHH
jgi:hypothetical protein